MAPLFIHTIIISQKRNTVDFIQVSFIIWSTVESIGVVKIEHHLHMTTVRVLNGTRFV
jgi:hypothetical protein